MSNLTEGMRGGDLKYLVSDYVSIDQYTSKINEDNITIALFCNMREAAEDLLDFIEKTYFMEIRDIEISDSLTTDNKFIVYVEFERNKMFPKLLLDMIDSIGFLTTNKKWTFKAFDMNTKEDLNEKNLIKYVRLQTLDNGAEKSKDVNESVNKMLKLKNGYYEQEYIDKGFVSESEFSKDVSESNSLNTRDSLEMELLENAYPDCEIVTTDENVYLIKGKKIHKLG